MKSYGQRKKLQVRIKTKNIMLAILKREIKSFFSSSIGYLVIGLFLVACGLFLWVFKGDYNIFDAGFADLSSFFNLVPWLFLFLIPAVSMRAFSDEKKMGTLELLLTKPISIHRIVLGKYVAIILLIVMALIPTFLYVMTISNLGLPPGNWDVGSTLGSYFGLFFLIVAFSAMGIFASTLSSNQIVAFLIAVFLSFVFYGGFAALENVTNGSLSISKLGMLAHFNSISRGVIDTRDLIYFICLSALFIGLTYFSIKQVNSTFIQKILQKKMGLFVLAIATISIFGTYFYKRFDLTQDKRFTLSKIAKESIKTADAPLIIDVFLKGNFPQEFKRLQQETLQLLEEFKNVNTHISYQFIDPFEENEGTKAIQQQLYQLGLKPAQVEVRNNGKIATEYVYPWALAYYNGKTVKIPLLKNKLGATTEERVNGSIQNLEYAFANGFTKLLVPKSKKVAVIKGNGELEDKYIADFFKTLKDYYYIAPFTLDSVASSPIKTLEKLNQFDLIVIANPTKAFSEAEKYTLDQYTMKGGASLWLIDMVEFKNLNEEGAIFGISKDLQLTNLFFKYGCRINTNLIKDVYSTPIMLASGSNNNAQYSRYPWFYYPLSSSRGNHPISTNLEAVKFEYASSIDTIANKIKKTILLSSSPLSKKIGVPVEININKEVSKNLKVVNEGPNPQQFKDSEQTLALLLEGKFTSLYKNRVKPFNIKNDQQEGHDAKIIVIGDGDLIKNQMKGNQPLELGFDKWTNTFYGNKEFLLNSVNYLLDDTGLINIRSKKVSIAFLDSEKTANQRTQWQLINLVIPLVFLGLFGFVFNYLRKRKQKRIC
ncbi:MAG: gliding motility-associated ABC transporter substrate-binding protein GldG [Flavobacteriales bacterium]